MKRTYSDAMSLSDSKNGLSFELHSRKNKLKARARLKLINGKLDCGTIIHKKHSEGQLLNLVTKEFHFFFLKFNFSKLLSDHVLDLLRKMCFSRLILLQNLNLSTAEAMFMIMILHYIFGINSTDRILSYVVFIWKWIHRWNLLFRCRK